jgi:hypothetical protein
MGRGECDGPDDESEKRANGWLVVAVIAVILLVGPGLLLVTTPRRPAVLAAYVVLAIATALAFGAVGVWTALRHGPGE